MSGFSSTKQLISISLRPKNIPFPPSERHLSTTFHHRLHHLTPRTPSISAVDRRRRVSAVSRPSTMAVGVLTPRASQAPTPRGSAPPPPGGQSKPDQFHALVDTLKEALGPSSGLDSSDVDVKALIKAMRAYDAKERGWLKYAFTDSEAAYTRNLVDEGNGKSNLVRLSHP